MTKIYLISPPNFVEKEFFDNLKNALKTGLVSAFQLRVKNYSNKEVENLARQVKKVCLDYNCPFLLNDYLDIALNLNLEGVHLGCEDENIALARKSSHKNFIIGASCYDSKHLAFEACEQGANYISFGTFFPSITKNSKGKPEKEIISWANEILDLPTVAIGGINDSNCSSLIKEGVDFLAIISYVWNHQKGVEFALKSISRQCYVNYQK